MAKTNKGLGRGLDSLFESSSIDVSGGDGVRMLPISSVEPNGEQPRRFFDEESLKALAESIKANGVLQPLLVREVEGRYQIIAGERRWRASRLAGLTEVPVLVKDFDDLKTFEIALVENLQREDLNPVEQSRGYALLIERFGLTQEAVSEKIGKSRPAITNSLRLLNLSDAVLEMIETGDISEGHGRAMLSLSAANSLKLAKRVVAEQLSVRQVETLVRSLGKKKKTPEKPVDYDAALQKQLESQLGRKVFFKSGAKKGKLTIEFYGNDDLGELLDRLGISVES